MPSQSLRGFTERVAVVSDGANVFGRAVAMQLALQGCYVVVGYAGASEENVRALNELQSIGTLASAVEADVSTIEGVNVLFENVAQTYGRLDLLVNTASFEAETDFLNTDAGIFAETIRRNLKAAFFCSQAGAKLMQNRPNPAIVNLSSEPAAGANALLAAVQAALVGLTKSLADELAPKIRVNCVSHSTGGQPQLQENELLRPKTAVEPNDVARTVVYLLSPEAAAISGQTISVAPKRSKI
jgi:3-oxoacyl-[acyl-carrier protein] reductase